MGVLRWERDSVQVDVKIFFTHVESGHLT